MEIVKGMMDMTHPPHVHESMTMTNDMGHNHGTDMDHNHGTGTDMDHDHGSDMDHSNHGSGMHSMYFSFSLPIQVLFYEWQIVNQGQLAGSCVGVFLFAILYEGMKVWRQHLIRKAAEYDHDSYKKRSSKISRIFNCWHLLQSLLHVLQTTFGMLLMLIYMTFNVWLAVAVSLGAGVGYFLFAWIIPINPDFGDHCNSGMTLTTKQ